MAILEGYEAANDHLLEVAKACAIAAARAPSLTGKLDLKMEILTGDDLKPMVDFLETFGKVSLFIRVDGTTYRKLLDEGKMPPVLFLGAELTTAVNWNCGGCGFATCAEFTKYVKKNRSVGEGAYGPSCLWKVIDFGIAADYACACAAMHRVDARIQMSMGAGAMFMGRMPDCSMVLGLPIGSVGRDVWFDRTRWQGELDYEKALGLTMGGAPNLYMAFTGGGPPIIKTKQRWWEDPTFMKIEQSPEIEEQIAEGKAGAFEMVMRHGGALDDDE